MHTTAVRSRPRLRLTRQALSLPLAFLSYFLLDFSLRLFYGTAADISLWAWQPLVFSALWALVLTCAAGLMPRLARRIFLLVTFTVFALLCVAHCALYKLTGNVFSFADLAYAGDGAKFFSLTYLNIRKAEWLSIAVCLALMMLAVVWAAPTRHPRGRTITCAALLLAGGLAIFGVHRSMLLDPSEQVMGWNILAETNSKRDCYTEFSNANRSLMLTGVYQHAVRSAAVTLAPSDWAGTPENYEKLDAYYAAHPKAPTDAETTGALAGDNLLLVMLESIDTWLVTPEYMPNLYALQQKSVSFPNYYSPIFISAATFNAEFTANTGLVAPTGGIVTSAYTDYAFPYSMANLFRNAGYSANSFHSSAAYIYDRGNIHQNFGFQAYHDCVKMGMDNYMLDSQLINGYDQYVTDDPFFSFLITYSGHGPYTTEQAAISDPHLARAQEVIDYAAVPYETDAQREEYTRAVAQAMETDQFIGELVAQLHADGHAEDTALVFFTDHYCKYLSDTDFLMRIKGEGEPDLLANVPFFIWSEKLPARVEHKYVSTMDILPTVINLFELDADLSYYIGSDMFGPDGGVVPMRDYHWFDGVTYCGEKGPVRVDGGTQTESLPASTLDPNAAGTDIRTQLDAVWLTFRSNYFSHVTASE